MNVDFRVEADEEMLRKSGLLRNWEGRIDGSIEVGDVVVETVDVFPGPRIGFMECTVRYRQNSVGGKENFLLSGGSVSMVLLIRCGDEDSYQTLLVRQPRLGAGILTYEFPAGMVDDSEDFRGVALREVEEECGLKLGEDELIDLNPILEKCYYSYPCLIDEWYHIFVGKLKMSKEQMNKINGRKGGVDEEEQITQHFFPFDDVWKLSTDTATIAIYSVVQKLLKEGKI